ncbi:universal stress protein [Halorussus halobius]|uniref:universal stress protein n=1 Tax=Halorussus halobius TaxID=1710537 RepID=UPI0010925BDF|nr:universal stress protein [Halorussus halobius]
MSILVPFDGSSLAKSALVRATELRDVFDERVLAVSIVPTANAAYAREHGWIGPDEEYDRHSAVDQLGREVAELAPAAGFRHQFVGRHASAGTIARKIRDVGQEVDASLVVIGSDNAGSLVSSIHSVGTSVASDDAFDVFIVRRPVPAAASTA